MTRTGRGCGGSGWTRHGWLVEDRAEEAAARAALADKYPQYVQRPPAGPVVGMRVTHWSAWSAAEAAVDKAE